MTTRKELIEALRARYRSAAFGDRIKILDEFVVGPANLPQPAKRAFMRIVGVLQGRLLTFHLKMELAWKRGIARRRSMHDILSFGNLRVAAEQTSQYWSFRFNHTEAIEF